MLMKINVFWFRRDLRLDDNTGLINALNSGLRVLPLFIFDTNITEELPVDDHRISFIYDTLESLNNELMKVGGSLCVQKGDPLIIWEKLIHEYEIESVFLNKDYEPYAIERDEKIASLLNKKKIRFLKFKDQVIFEENEIIKSDNNPYTIFTPYKNRWMQKVKENPPYNSYMKGMPAMFYQSLLPFPSLDELGFRRSA
jgi:deoxyribodipyrimidine photo-lyase